MLYQLTGKLYGEVPWFHEYIWARTGRAASGPFEASRNLGLSGRNRSKRAAASPGAHQDQMNARQGTTEREPMVKDHLPGMIIQARPVKKKYDDGRARSVVESDDHESKQR